MSGKIVVSPAERGNDKNMAGPSCEPALCTAAHRHPPYLSASEIAHTHNAMSVFACLTRETAHRLPASVDKPLHLKPHEDSPPPLPLSRVQIHLTYVPFFKSCTGEFRAEEPIFCQFTNKNGEIKKSALVLLVDEVCLLTMVSDLFLAAVSVLQRTPACREWDKPFCFFLSHVFFFFL